LLSLFINGVTSSCFLMISYKRSKILHNKPKRFIVYLLGVLVWM
jgi:hypothetical protein